VGTTRKLDDLSGPNAEAEVGAAPSTVGTGVAERTADGVASGTSEPANLVENVHGTPPLSYFVSPIRI